MKADKDNEALKRYWLGCERLVHKLVEKCDIEVAEADSGDSKVIVGYTVGESDAVLHYVLTRRKMMRMGVARDLLQPFLAGHRVLYSFRPAARGLKVPPQFQYDPYCALKWLKA